MLTFVLSAAAIAPAQSDYQLRPLDTVSITVVDQADLTKKYLVDDAGRIAVPLVGSVGAAGLTVHELAGELRRQLGAFFTDPEVHATIERARRVFVFGGVTSPGMYQLTDNMTLIELLARAGSGAAAEALIIRAPGSVAPALPPSDLAGAAQGSDVIRVNLRELEKDLQSGILSRNIVLEEADTVYIPRFDPNRIYVSGEVRTAGAYSVPDGTTVLQALTLAGGVTPDASLGRVRILRLTNGRQERLEAKPEEVVKPGDTILVPRRFF